MSSTPSPQDDSPETPPEDAPDTRSPLTDRWWWSAALWMVVGGGVIVYQSGPIRTGSAIALTWVMVAVGAAVAIRGAMMLWNDWKIERERATPPDPSDLP